MSLNSYTKQTEPVIATQIFDHNLPSELLDQNLPKSHEQASQSIVAINKSQIKTHYTNHYATGLLLQSYQIKGKSIFKQTPTYKAGQTISFSLFTFSAKFPSQGKGWRSIWDSFKGYSKRQIYMSEGFFYVLQRTGPIGYYVHHVWPLDDLFKVFYDIQASKVRLVFAVGHMTQNKDFEILQRIPLFQKLKEELNKIGRQM